MIKITSYSPEFYNAFAADFKRYFTDELGIPLSDAQFTEIAGDISKSALNGIISVDILLAGEQTAGFIIYQIDSPQSDWCEKEGWGFIRELYVKPENRNLGAGSLLVSNAEKTLLSRGARNFYLTSDHADPFWLKQGYTKTGEASTINGDPIWAKIM